MIYILVFFIVVIICIIIDKDISPEGVILYIHKASHSKRQYKVVYHDNKFYYVEGRLYILKWEKWEIVEKDFGWNGTEINKHTKKFQKKERAIKWINDNIIILEKAQQLH